MPLITGTRLGTYEILGTLGAGAMGEVYRAKDLRLGRDVAIKVLPDDVASSAERLALFEDEARTVAGLNHPNIVTLYSIEEEEGIRFLTMELLEGQPLDAVVASGSLPLDSALDLATQLAEALDATHAKGIIHRDLRPANVLVTPSGRVKLVGYGFATVAHHVAARVTDETRTEGPTPGPTSGRGAGTVSYQSPEQLRGSEADARSDLFALGVMVYELVAGRRPFSAATDPDIVSSILRDAPAPLGTVRHDVPRGLDALAARCLEKDRARRNVTAREVVDALRALRGDGGSGIPAVREERAVAARASTHAPTVAVLPFVNRSHSEEDEYFSDGLAEEILNVLAKVRGVRVAARTSSFQFRKKDEDLASIGRRLNVATVLEGSVRKVGNRVRIAVQLADVSSGYHLWSGTYDRTLDDIFEVQDDIAHSVVRELRPRLFGEEEPGLEEVAAAAVGRSRNPEAHRLYLEGHHLGGQGTTAQIARGVESVERAVTLDPDFTVAWAWLTRAYLMQRGSGRMEPEQGAMLARHASDQALRSGPGLPEAIMARASVQVRLDWDFRGAAASQRRAMEQSPGSADVVRWGGIIARILGRLEEATELNERAAELDPLSVGSYISLGLTYRVTDRFADSERMFRRALDLAPERSPLRSHVALALLAQGRVEEAMVEADRESHGPLRLFARAVIHAAGGSSAEANRALRDLVDGYGDEVMFQVAQVHAVRGEMDAAFECLERAYDLRDYGLVDIKCDLLLRPLHGDPRWQPYLAKLGLEDSTLAGARDVP